MRDHNHEKRHPHENHLENDNLNSFSLQEKITFKNPVSQGEIKDRVLKIVSKIGKKCIEQGADIIGHIKGRIEMEEILRFSMIEPEEGIETDGDIKETLETDQATIKILAVVPLREEILTDMRESARRDLLSVMEKDGKNLTSSHRGKS